MSLWKTQRERERERHPVIASVPNPFPEGADLHGGRHLKKQSHKKPTKQQILVWTWKAFSAGKGDEVIHVRHRLANLSDGLFWGTIYSLPNFWRVQCTLVLSPLSALLLPALPVTDAQELRNPLWSFLWDILSFSE